MILNAVHLVGAINLVLTNYSMEQSPS